MDFCYFEGVKRPRNPALYPLFPFTKGDTAKPRGFLHIIHLKSSGSTSHLLSIKEDKMPLWQGGYTIYRGEDFTPHRKLIQLNWTKTPTHFSYWDSHLKGANIRTQNGFFTIFRINIKKHSSWEECFSYNKIIITFLTM